MLIRSNLNPLLFFTLFINVIAAVYLDVGDECYPRPRTSDRGVCAPVINCPDALRYIEKMETIPFLRCGFKKDMEIICCPTSSSYVTKSPVQRYDSPRILEKQCQKIINDSLPPLDLHIIGGKNAQLGEFPHMAALGHLKSDGYDFFCGGTLISENYILTAAHCVDNIEKITPSIARLGVVNIETNEFNPETDIRISKSIIHPGRSSTTKYHDLALLKLEQPAQYSVTLVPACLYTGETIPAVPLTVTGWGKISVTKEIRSKILQKANVTLVASSECEKSYENWRKLPSGIRQGQFCAGDPLGRTDACQGDSGGPIQALTSSDGHYRILGVISFGRGCASTVPGVYTRLYPYLEWIESVVWPNGI